MKIAYGKLGRSIPLTLDDASNVGGDIEVVNLLHRLLKDGHDVHLIGRNRGIDAVNGTKLGYTETPSGGELVDQWGPGGVFENPPPASRHRDETFTAYDAFLQVGIKQLPRYDAVLIWLGQHGSSVHPVPAVQEGKKGTYTNPMVSDVNYGYPLVAFCNYANVKPIFLCPDPRNMVKFRDLWEPTQRDILAQYDTSKANTFYDERDGRLRTGGTTYRYAGIELLALQSQHELRDDHRARHLQNPSERLFGVLVNEGYSNLGSKGRCHLVKSWLKNLEPYEMFGTWSEGSQKELSREIHPVDLLEVLPTLRRWRSTITFPATGGGWATAKPWEAFLAGTVCFKHPGYDTQHHIYSPTFMPPELRSFLCPPTVSGLVDRVKQLRDDATWRSIVELQWEYLAAMRKRLDDGYGIVKVALEMVSFPGVPHRTAEEQGGSLSGEF